MPSPSFLECPRPPGLIIGGTGSHAGKTALTLALLCALRRRGMVLAAAKVGPDYIDTAFHAAMTGQPVANLDTWMCREAAPSSRQQGSRLQGLGLRRVFQRMQDHGRRVKADLLVIEGAMGLFDGGHDGAGSTAQLSAQFGLPVLLTLNASGMGQSAAAVAEGFLRYCPSWTTRSWQFLGMVCTHVGSDQHARILRQALTPVAKNFRVPLLGMLPRRGAPDLPSRYLGLVEARQVLPSLQQESLAQWLEAHCHVDKLLDLLGMSHCRFPRSAEPLSSGATFTHTTSETISPGTHFFAPRRSIARKVRPLVGIAWDEAFSFCYADLPALIAELGAETVFFSPLRDPAPPTGCVGLYFPGGYPELYAPALRANMSMITFLHRLAAQGMPMYGECGGYIYLMQAVTVNGVRHAMSGLLPRSCTLGKERVALGYRAARALPGWPVSGKELRQPLWVRGHEFHYALEDLGESETDGGSPFSSGAGVPLWKLHDSSGALLYDDGCRCGAVAGSWLHCYPEGSRRFWKLWLRTLLDRN